MKNSDVKIAILGYGFVGKKVFGLFKDYFGDEVHSHILIYDPFIKDEDFGSRTKEEINTANLAIVCVPTEMKEDGTCNTEIVEDSIKWLKTPLILIKSTVPPGTTRQLTLLSMKKIAFSPEFVGESTYFHPFWDKMIEEPALIIGAQDKKVAEDILDFFQPILGPTKTFAITDSQTAELCKYMENTFFATKVIFANEMKKIADIFGVSYYELRELWALDPRVNKMHTSVFKGKLGFGGKCLIAGTKLRTSKNKLISIENLTLKNLIFDGNKYTKILKLGRRKVKNVIQLRARGRIICGSKDHIHLIYKNKKLIKKELKNINTQDWIYIPKQKNSQSLDYSLGKVPNGYIKWWKEKFNFDKDWARVIGLYLAEGCLYAKEYSAIWSFGEKEKYLAEEVKTILRGKGLNPYLRLQVSQGTYGESRCWIVRCRSYGLFKLFTKLKLGKNSHSKNCPILPNNLAKYLIGGWLDGDGSYYNGTIAGASVSKSLIAKIDIMLLSLGINSQLGTMVNDAFTIKISMRKDVEKICSWTKRLKFDKKRYIRNFAYASPTMREFKDGWIVKVNKIQELKGRLVYSLETKSHKYVANNILTHNCFPKDLSALIEASKKAGYNPEFLKEVQKSNARFTKENN